jgi:aminoglycoside phosphotransferase (APT) family kinase protein
VDKTESTINSLAPILLQYLKREWKLPSLRYQNWPIPITGGFETSIYKIQLQGTPSDIPETLVLRIFKHYASPRKALQETVVQNAVASAGIPAPRVFLTCMDKSIFGGEFNIMEYVSGRSMFEMQQNDLPETLGRTHARLHDVDPVPIMKLIAMQGFSEERFSLQGQLNGMQKRIDQGDYDWVQSGLAWLRQNEPPITKIVICHGDFHPQNILIYDGEVSGVLDWSNFRVTDPMLDIATTKVLLTILAPVLVPGSIPSDFMERYLAAYQTRHPINTERLKYFEVVRLVLGLIDGADGQNAWRHPDVLIQIDDVLKENTGLKINIPKYL